MQALAVVLAPGSINHIANIVKGYAIAVGVVFAIWIVWRWWQTRTTEMAADRAARAKSVWSRQLAQAIAHPHLADPSSGGITTPLEVTQYRSFVGGLLASADEILHLEPTEAWRATLARHLAVHRAYLGSAEFRDTTLADCSAALREVIGKVIATGV
ncbi:MAG: hypothetical protein AB7O57_16995 [Hyphomicrobiaceae bacterium]